MADLLKTMLVVAVAFLLTPGAAAGQERPDIHLSLHGNTGSTPMLGINYRLAQRTTVRLALGYYQFEKIHYEVDCSAAYPCVPPDRPLRRESQHTVRQYSGSVSAFYRPFARKLFTTSVGLEGQYLRARAPVPVGISRRETNDRFSVSGLAKLSIRPVQWLAISGQVGAGYLRGMPTNSSASFDLRTTRWGYTHVGLGLHVFWQDSLAAGALAGFGAGVLAGGLLDYHLIDKPNELLLAGTYAGAVVGVTFLTPLGAHLMNRRRGHYGLGLLGAGLVSTDGYYALKAVDHPDPASCVVGGIIAAHVSVSVAIEHLTSP